MRLRRDGPPPEKLTLSYGSADWQRLVETVRQSVWQRRDVVVDPAAAVYLGEEHE